MNSDLQINEQMIELLNELKIVENEINLLENQIKELKSKAKQEKMEPNLQELPLNPCNKNNTIKRVNEKATIEMKALHFITKAIKGDYKLNDFNLNEKAMNSKRFPTPKENPPSKRIGILRRPSPLRDQTRHPTPKVGQKIFKSLNFWSIIL